MIQRNRRHWLLSLLIAFSLLPMLACDDGEALQGGLDGTFGANWIPLAGPANVSPLSGLQSFHYARDSYLYDFAQNVRYDIAANSWSELEEDPPFGNGNRWVNGAVNTTGIWIPRNEEMHRFKLQDATWTTEWSEVQDGSERASAAVMDGQGFVWYCTERYLVRHNPADGTAVKYRHRADINLDHTRLAYDPAANVIAFAGHESREFLLFFLDSSQFVEGSRHPDGPIHDNTCQDRSGGIYTGNSDFTKMYRYNIHRNTWTELPLLPAIHDDESSCVVSQNGLLYYATNSSGATQFFALPLGRVQ